MTRDEAEIQAIRAVGFEFSEDARRHIAILEALGMINLGEPDSDWNENGRTSKVRKFMRRFHLSDYSPGQLYSALESAGLQIIEKGQ